jgi:hypothetical protein
MNRIVIEGLVLLVAQREEALHTVVQPAPGVTTWDRGYTTAEKRKGNDLSNNVKNHARKILAAVEAYEQAVEELEKARKVRVDE